MKNLRSAIFNALSGNAKLVALTGGSDAITQAWPAQEALYTPSNLGDPYDTLPLISPPRARVSFMLVTPSRDLDVPRRDDTFQIDVWGPNADLVETIVEELEATLDQNSTRFIPLAPTGSFVKETYCSRLAELYEATTRIFHTPINLRVLWNP